MDGTDVLVVSLVATGGVLCLAVAFVWRSSVVAGSGVPLWGFLRREGITREDAADTVSAKTVMHAEMSCNVCGSREECRARLAAGGEVRPPENCPNALLFNDFGIATDKARR